MRASRLMAILILLQLRVRLTAEALAGEFEVSVRTIYRDIDSLSAAGIPVYGERGPGGGFQLLDGYRTRLTGLASDEAEAMPMIGLPGPAAALGLGPAAARARGKLMASLGDRMRDEAGRMSARFHLDSVDWYHEADDVRYLPALARAVLDQVPVTMTYESWKTTGEWTVEPLGLVLKAGGWYLVATGGKKIRMFNVAMVRGLSAGEGRFERPDGFDLPTWWTAELTRFEAELRPEVATIRATPLGLRRLAALGAFAARAVREAEGETVRLPIETSDHSVLSLLGIGPEIEVIEPPELRARLRTLAEAIAARAA